MRLQAKRALITGAARGIGLDFARAYIAEGATVTLADINRVALDAAVAELGPHARAVVLDVTDQASIEAGFAAAIADPRPRRRMPAPWSARRLAGRTERPRH